MDGAGVSDVLCVHDQVRRVELRGVAVGDHVAGTFPLPWGGEQGAAGADRRERLEARPTKTMSFCRVSKQAEGSQSDSKQ